MDNIDGSPLDGDVPESRARTFDRFSGFRGAPEVAGFSRLCASWAVEARKRLLDRLACGEVEQNRAMLDRDAQVTQRKIHAARPKFLNSARDACFTDV